MYVDAANPLKDQHHLEENFGKLECNASRIYRKIIKAYEDGRPAIWLQRTEKDTLRKFIFLLAYRSEQYHRHYNVDDIQSYDADDKELLRDYMQTNGLAKPIDVWFQSLEAIINLEMDAEGHWQYDIKRKIYFPIADLFVDHICNTYLAICTPESGDEEFVLTENGYNVWEGPTTHYLDESTGKHVCMSPRFHSFAPISPRLMIVLRSNLLPEMSEDADPDIRQMRQLHREMWIGALYGPGKVSIMEDLPVRKAINSYMELANGRLTPKPGWSRRLDKNDDFSFSFFPISTRHSRIINGLLLDHAFHGSKVMFNRKDAFLDLIEWYLTEPCEVGKNVMGEHAGKQMEYIKGLARFMLREGREVEASMAMWPSQTGLDMEQFLLGNIAGARALRDMMMWDEPGFL
ncbi:hypothetical protein Trco_001856 [Trichoderma cornu-damae]|uniref:Uncharacterized protein n=1 Tax=Trichoderma cornu-damae TaxID=654480 RepID=A0A9P8QLI5_9HYPO|nr:hypothetical protein Trco_001856 [Trichoderma cornu-damae]